MGLPLQNIGNVGMGAAAGRIAGSGAQVVSLGTQEASVASMQPCHDAERVFTQGDGYVACMPKGPASVPRLALTRPHGPLHGSIRSVQAFLQHGFVFNRRPFRSDLGTITPKNPDAFDRANYRRDGPYLVSRHNPAFVLADMGRVTSDTIIAMLALGRSLAMRVPVRRPDGSVKSLSVYLVADHTWALWGWVEAAARGELAWEDNILVHVDDHDDMMGFEKTQEVQKLTLETAVEFIEQHVRWKQDPAGIASFIAPAALTGFLGSIFWEYGVERTADTERQYEARRRSAISMATICIDPGTMDDDDWIVEGGLMVSILSRCEIRPHNDYTHFMFPDEFYERFHGRFSAHRSDCFPFYETDLEGPLRGERRLILDIDIDVQDKAAPVYLIADRHLTQDQLPDCITIAISPQFGALDNHLLKAGGILSLIHELT